MRFEVEKRFRVATFCLPLLWLLNALLAPFALAKDVPALQRAAPSAASPAAENGKVVGRPFDVDEVWGGTAVTYDAVAVGRVVYVAYYDTQRKLCVTRIDTMTGAREKKTLGSEFAGWDAHNGVTLDVDRSGILHVAGNMHVVPLVYARTRSKDDFNSLELVNKMVGRDEAKVTYPRFIHFPNGDLGFSYRDGSSGDGVELIDRFDGQHWQRVLDTPLFGPAPGHDKVNAYYPGYVKGPDGKFHVAWVWRDAPAVELNFNVNYARSTDLVHWETSRGTPLTLPITPANAETVERIPVRSGLMNNIKVGFDLKGLPIISYLKYDSAGNSQLFHARPSSSGWQLAQATKWDYRWEFSGGGTISSDISFGGVRVEEGKLLEDVAHKKYGRLNMLVDENTLTDTAVPKERPKLPGLGRSDAVEAPYHVYTRPVRSEGAPKGVEAVIRWTSLGSENNDKPRTCRSSGLPEKCAMTSKMELFVR